MRRSLSTLLLLPFLFAFMGVPTDSPNNLTFWWWKQDDAGVLPGTIECALSRIRAATCLPVDVSFDAHHWVRFRPEADMGGMAGRTTGSSWADTRIALLEGIEGGYACNVLTHEIAQHTLRRRNDHSAPYTNDTRFRLYPELVTEICEVQDCGCFNPEAD